VKDRRDEKFLLPEALPAFELGENVVGLAELAPALACRCGQSAHYDQQSVKTRYSQPILHKNTLSFR